MEGREGKDKVGEREIEGGWRSGSATCHSGVRPERKRVIWEKEREREIEMVRCDWWLGKLRRKREKKRKQKREIDKIGPHVNSSLGHLNLKIKKIAKWPFRYFQSFENYILTPNFKFYYVLVHLKVQFGSKFSKKIQM